MRPAMPPPIINISGITILTSTSHLELKDPMLLGDVRGIDLPISSSRAASTTSRIYGDVLGGFPRKFCPEESD
jgi:hypothetical protein